VKIVERLQKVRDILNSDGTVGARKGTTCNVLSDGTRKIVEKQWVFGDWVFSAEYEYEVAKYIYHTANSMGLSAPKLLDFDDAERKLQIEYIPGSRPKTPCSDLRLLPMVLRFYDGYRGITFPKETALEKMDGDNIHKYRTDQLQYLFRNEKTWKEADAIYESFLRHIQYVTLPFDRILHNALLSDSGLAFVDFEWTISGPHEFTLARIAVEFNRYDDHEILNRVESQELYLLFLLRFYLYGRQPETLRPFLDSRIPNGRMRTLFDLIDENVRSRGK
jgi:hypothetical protein